MFIFYKLLDMKKLLTIVAILLLGQTALFAQKNVKESDVPQRYVKDFQNRQKEATAVNWLCIDSTTFEVEFVVDQEAQSMVFSPKGTETHYFVEEKYCPKSIKDTISKNYGGYQLKQIYVRNVKNKTTYQAKIVKRCGFLFWRKDCSTMLLNFDTTGKFIDDQQI